MNQLPITLIGDTISERHRYFNELVANTHKNKTEFNKIENGLEHSPIDRIFKINLACKCRNVDYLLKNLKDDDMLFVAKALKAKWLIDDKYENIICPDYLENTLYPEMITTAANKMKHWILLNLKNEKRCGDFYQYYFDKDLKHSINFLTKCSPQFIIEEFPKVVNEITPHQLKLFCEKTPISAKLFYNNLKNKKHGLQTKHKVEYFNSIKCILKKDADIYLDIVEIHFLDQIFPRLSAFATKYIITNKKERYFNKPELYAAVLLNVPALAELLSSQECEDLVILLARSTFIQHWFSYKNVEPLIKRLDKSKRAEFKNKVFVKKDIGDDIKDWPYDPPGKQPEYEEDCSGFFDDDENVDMYSTYYSLKSASPFLCQSMPPGLLPIACAYSMPMTCNIKPRTVLDKLFDEYRFSSFDKTFYNLKQRIIAEPSPENRMFMMLVLVSKAGEGNDNLKLLLNFLMKHCNEPSHIRAAVIRSLVKRASIWRAPDDIWEKVLTFGRGLGLDGNTPEADCKEGLHAALIRSFLHSGSCTDAIKKAYLQNISTLTEYSLSSKEKSCIAFALPKIIMESIIIETNVNVAVDLLMHLMKILRAYNIRPDNYPNFISSVKNVYVSDPKVAESILLQLYQSKIGRTDLMRENFNLIQTDESYVNALKHDPSMLTEDTFINLLNTKKSKVRFDNFLRKLSLYYHENILTKNLLKGIKKIDAKKNTTARPLAILIGAEFVPYINELETKQDSETRRFCASFKANSHLVRPVINLDTIEWKKAGVKFIANRVLVCKPLHVESNISNLLAWNRSAKLAYILAQRGNKESKVFSTLVEISPSLAFKCMLDYFYRLKDKADIEVWKIVKPSINNIGKLVATNEHVGSKVFRIESLPLSIKSEYISVVYPMVSRKDKFILLKHILVVLPQTDINFMNTILSDLLKNEPINNTIINRHKKDILLVIQIITRYLLLCKDEGELKTKYDSFGDIFMKQLEDLHKTDKELFKKCLNKFLESLKYYEVFMNEKYISSLILMERIVDWMHKILPIEKYFEYYVLAHLMMLCFKAIRESVKKYPEIFGDKLKKDNDGVIIFGEIYGKYISNNCYELVSKYFESIVELYSNTLNKNIQIMNTKRSTKFIAAFIKGMFIQSKGTECRLSLNLFRDYNFMISLEQQNEIRKVIEQSNNKETLFFYYNQAIRN